MAGLWSNKPKGRAALPLLERLRSVDPDVQCERKFEWLFLPRSDEMSAAETRVAAGLVVHCRKTKAAHPRKADCDCGAMLSDARVKGRSRSMEFDFWLPNLGVAIEFDERQHFTKERAFTLEHYEGRFPFDVERWRNLCSGTVQDPDPPCRDWQRAFRDTVRDFRARDHGLDLLRIHYLDRSLATCDLHELIEKARVKA